MGKGAWVMIGIVVFFRAVIIGSENIEGSIQQNVQSIQWVGLALLIIMFLLAEIVFILKPKSKTK